jgi:hypothetical protein
MRVILFIGQHKVGSSALQSYLAKNAASLLDQGILYPAVETQGMQRLEKSQGYRRFLQRFAMSQKGQLHMNISEAHNALAFSMMSDVTGKPVPTFHTDLPDTQKMIENIQNQIIRYKPHTVILAAEVFSAFGNLEKPPITRLLSVFPSVDLTITATLRRVDDHLVSWHGQRLRFGEAPPRLSEGRIHDGIQFNSRKLLEPWIETCTGATWSLRNYTDVMTSGGSVPDFFHVNRLPLNKNYKTKLSINKGLHRALMEIARRGNAELTEQLRITLFQTLLKIGPQLDLPNAKDIEMFGTEVRAKLYARYTPIHDYISHFSGHTFFPNLYEMLSPRPVPEAMASSSALDQIRMRHHAAFPIELFEWLSRLDLSEEILSK